MRLYNIVIVFALLLSSCLKEEPGEGCPDQYQITLNVKDKNYQNIRDIPELTPVDENMPFKNYISGISYQLKNLANGNIVAFQNYQPVTSSDISPTLSFNNIPAGTYRLSVWGDIPSAPGANSGTFVSLHPNGEESTDSYICSDTLSFTDNPASKNVFMKRLKGNLVILCKNFPPETDKILARIDSVYNGTDDNQNYSQAVTVTKTFPGQSTLLETQLAPSVAGKQSSLTLLLFTPQNSEPYLITPSIKFRIERNKITELMVDFNNEMNIIQISIRIDGKWNVIHQLTIN